MIFNRIEYKAQGKAAFKRAYWLCVLACFIVMLLTGGFGNGSGRGDNDGHGDHGHGYYESHGELLPEQGGVAGAFTDRAFASVSGRFEAPMNLLRGLAVGALGALTVFISCLGLVFSLLVSNPVEVGGKRFFMENRVAGSRIEALIYGFKNSYGNVVLTMFKRSLFTFLWSLLLIVPGVIKYYSYMLVPYILSENPGMDSNRALQLSSELMDGHKFDAFVMDLSFLGWYILSVLTLGLLGVFWVNPYYEASKAELYNAMRSYARESNSVADGELPGYPGAVEGPAVESGGSPEL